MKKLFLSGVLALVMAFFYTSQAQNYTTGVGLRFEWNSGISIKHFVNSKNAFEGMAFLFPSKGDGVEFALLYEYHGPFFEVENMNYYAGFGGHIGFWDRHGSDIVIGPDGILGLEYTFEDAPINLALDWHPFINLIGDYEPWLGRGGFTIRYVIK
jgi:hypothetical protein